MKSDIYPYLEQHVIFYDGCHYVLANSVYSNKITYDRDRNDVGTMMIYSMI